MAVVNLDTAARLDIICRKGDSFSLTVEFDTEIPDQQAPSSFWKLDVQETDTSETQIIQLDGNSFSRDSENTKKLTITATGSEMNVASGLYVYDLQHETTAGARKTYLYGTFRINEDVTDQ